MSTMKEMAGEYRSAAAKLSMRLAEKLAAGASQKEVASLRGALQNIREVQRTLDGYYDIPRSGPFAATGWKCRRSPDDKC